MIATILPSSLNFHAVEYNERKVAKGVAELIEIKNFGYLQDTGRLSAQDLRQYLMEYSERNKRIEKAQFHVAISCKGNEYTPEQLLDIAHQWLDKMGYGQEGQPLLVYAHHDTKNNHIHIITSRVDPQGKKIDHNKERIRSQKVLNEIMGVDRREEMHQVIKDALAYKFETLGQFKAILESSGYETYTDENRDNLFVKKDGVVLGQITVKELEKYYKKLDRDATTKRRKQLWSILMKYRDQSKNKEELATELRKKFGISLVFLGRKDNPYGYIIVDHNNKTVYKGNDIMAIKKLMQFGATREEVRDPKKITAFIRKKMDSQPDISTYEINKLLQRKYGVRIKAGQVSKDTGFVYKGDENLFELDQTLYDKLKYNGRVKWLQSFKPSSWEECEILAKFGHLENAENLHVSKDIDQGRIDATKSKFSSILASTESDGNVFDELNKSKIIVMRKEGKFYAVDMENKTVIDLEKEDVDVSRLHGQLNNSQAQGNSQSKSESHRTSLNSSLGNILRPTDGGHHANREWEISSGSDEYDDERTLKR